MVDTTAGDGFPFGNEVESQQHEVWWRKGLGLNSELVCRQLLESKLWIFKKTLQCY